MIAVGIDVSKSKSTVAILNSDGSQLIKPYDMKHNHSEMNALVNYLNELDEPLIILMEYTGHYHYPVLKKLTDEHFSVCLVNPYQMKKYGDTELRRSKTDRKDAIRIATYALEKSYQLVPYSIDDQKYVDFFVYTAIDCSLKKFTVSVSSNIVICLSVLQQFFQLQAI